MPRPVHKLHVSRSQKLAERSRRKRTDRIPSIKMKHVFRVRAHDPKDRLVFFKTRTKMPETTIKRFATLHGFKPDRIKH